MPGKPVPKLQNLDAAGIAAGIAIVIGATGGIGQAFVHHLRDCSRFDGVIDGLQPSQSGGFFAYDGSELPW